ncbi:MAG: hypothetical protein WCA39_12440, partial [Nitrososphaeraceae archaeon]
RKYTLLFLPSDASFIGSNSRTQHECTSKNYSLFFVPNVWVLPNIIYIIYLDQHQLQYLRGGDVHSISVDIVKCKI